jgi:hypothetical protein
MTEDRKMNKIAIFFASLGIIAPFASFIIFLLITKFDMRAIRWIMFDWSIVGIPLGAWFLFSVGAFLGGIFFFTCNHSNKFKRYAYFLLFAPLLVLILFLLTAEYHGR